MMRKLPVALGALAVAIAVSPQAEAQKKWPVDGMTIIVPFAPGGAVDFTARLLQDALSKSLGVSVVVENRAGGAGIPAAEALIRAKPDGATISLIASAFVANSVLTPKVPYDPIADTTPISRVVKNTSLFVVQPDSKFTSIPQLIAEAKANPGSISYLTPGVGTAQHLAGELFQMQAGVKLNHVPYKGAGPALNDMLGGHAPLAIIGIGPLKPHIQAGKLKAIGISTSPRSPVLPEVATVAEQGLPDYSYGEWFGVVAPKNFPPELVARLQAALVEASKSGDFKKRLEDLGLEAEATTPAELSKFMAEERVRIKEIAAKADLLPK